MAAGRRSNYRRSNNTVDSGIQVVVEAAMEQVEQEELTTALSSSSSEKSAATSSASTAPATPTDEEDLGEIIDEEKAKKDLKKLKLDLTKARKQAIEDRLILVNKEIAALDSGNQNHFSH